MKKSGLIVCLSIILCIVLLPVQVQAHPGKTDSKGGHYDRSTGEYHYHHGYPAHDHYDIDGDGVVDCPYDFKDKTNHENENSVSHKKINKTDNIKHPTHNATYNKTEKPASQSKDKEEKKVGNQVYGWIIIIMAILLLILIICLENAKTEITKIKHSHAGEIDNINDLHQKEIEKIKHENEEEIKIYQQRMKLMIDKYEIRIENIYSASQKQNEKVEKEIAEEKNTVKSIIRNILSQLSANEKRNILYSMSDAPAGDFVGDDRLPATKPNLGLKWGDKYTFYYNEKSHVYHNERCHCRSACIPMNAADIRKLGLDATPCRSCCPQLPRTAWVDKYNAYADFFKKYNIILIGSNQ